MSLPEQLARAAALDRNLSDDAYLMVVRALRGLDPVTGEAMPEGQPTELLPAPPNGEKAWSIVTLAEYLCVPPAEVDIRLAPVDEHGESPDFRSNRSGAYVSAAGEDLGDCYLWDDAADRIAADLPVGLLAHRIVAGTHVPGLDAGQVRAFAQHIVTHLGGAR